MLQVDNIMSMALGASLATAAYDGLRATSFRTQNFYFVYTILYFSLVTAPLNVYMLWEHTGFETMFYYDASMHGMWPAINSFLNTLCGVIGFQLARKIGSWGQEMSAYTFWITLYTIVLAIVNSHYDRVFYPGGIRDFNQGKTYTLLETVQSELFITLCVSLLLVAIPVYYAQINWPSDEGLLNKARKSEIKWHCVRVWFYEGIAVTFLTTLLLLGQLAPENFDWDKVAAVAFGHVAYGVIILWPVFFMSTKYTVTKRIELRRNRERRQETKPKRRTANSSNQPVASSVQFAADELNEPDFVHVEMNGTTPNEAASLDKRD